MPPVDDGNLTEGSIKHLLATMIPNLKEPTLLLIDCSHKNLDWIVSRCHPA